MSSMKDDFVSREQLMLTLWETRLRLKRAKGYPSSFIVEQTDLVKNRFYGISHGLKL